MPVQSSVHVRIIRDSENKSTDDKVLISPCNDGTISVKYTDNSSTHTTHQYLNLGEISLGTYVRELLLLVSKDEQPFAMIQFDFPGFPSVVFTHATVKRDKMLRKTLFRVANMISTCWESEQLPPLIPLETYTRAESFNEPVESHW
jgi:hypothetical protein